VQRTLRRVRIAYAGMYRLADGSSRRAERRVSLDMDGVIWPKPRVRCDLKQSVQTAVLPAAPAHVEQLRQPQGGREGVR
jgi:hypothetical protein